MKALSKKLQDAAGKIFKNPKVRNAVNRVICFVTGHPVDVATGKVFTDHVDFELPGPIPLVWERVWFSTTETAGALGHGWHHSYELALAFDQENRIFAMRLADGRAIGCPFLDEGESMLNPREKMEFFRDRQGYGVRNIEERLVYRFSDWPLGDFHPITRIENTAGQAILFEYSATGHLQRITDSAGRVLPVNTDHQGRILTVHAPHPKYQDQTFPIVAYSYDQAGDLIAAKDALDNTFSYRYNQHLLVQETSPNNLSFYFEYDGDGHGARCIRTYGDNGIYDHKLSYNLEEKYTVVENSLGQKSTHYWNDLGLVYRSIDPLGNSTVTRYNEAADIVSETDELGRVTAYQYDEQSMRTGVSLPDGSGLQMTYENNLLTAVTDQNGGQWAWEYDEWGQLIKRVTPLGAATTYTYEQGRLSTITDPAGGVTTIAYDADFNLSRLTTPDGASSSWAYDRLGRCIAATDPRGNVQRRKFTLTGWVRQVNEPDGNKRELTFDREGNVIRAVDQHHDVRFEYGGMNRLKARIENGTRVTFDYNTEEDLIAISNEEGSVYRFELDERRDVVAESGFDGLTRRYIRDAAGRVAKVERPAKTITEYQYDALDRVLEVIHSDDSQESFRYRADGELIAAENRHIKVHFERDAMGRVTKETQGSFVVESIYDVLGMRTQLSSSLGAQLDISRNKMGDVEQLDANTRKGNWSASFERDLQGLEIQRSLPGGIRSEWKRDRLGRPIEQKTVSAGGHLSRNRQYKWGVNDRLQQIIDPEKGSWTFEHDTFGNLAGARYPDGTEELRMPNAVGNLFKKRDQQDRTYGLAGQLEQANGNHYEYDAEGNLIQKTLRDGSVWRYEWNAGGMLIRVHRPDGDTVSFTYDALGRRISKSYRGRTTYWVWDGNVPLHEWTTQHTRRQPPKKISARKKDAPVIHIRRRQEQLATAPAMPPPAGLATEETTKTIPAPTSDLTTWLFEPESFTPVAKLRNGQQFSIVTDYLGTPAGMYDATGEKVWEMDLSIYGEVRNLEGWREACPFRYPGQYEDVETGLYYNRFRYFDPEIGGYVSQDPIGLLGGIALYGYVPDPCNWVDELGLEKCYRQKNRGGYRLVLKLKDGWTPAQIRAARKKIRLLNKSKNLRKTKPNRGNKSAASVYRKSGKSIPENADIDHAIELQLGGADSLDNMWPLDSSVNRSVGSQINHLIKDLPEGTRITSTTIE